MNPAQQTIDAFFSAASEQLDLYPDQYVLLVLQALATANVVSSTDSNYVRAVSDYVSQNYAATAATDTFVQRLAPLVSTVDILLQQGQ